MGRVYFSVAAALVLAGLAWVAKGVQIPPRSPEPCSTILGPVALPDIPEVSGLAVSRRTPRLLWAHNDSGHESVLFALDQSGVLRGRVRVPLRTRDWEDVSAAPCGSDACLYIADIGDNGRSRDQVYIYRVSEPTVDDTSTGAPERFTATYADGRHNAEAMFVLGDHLFIVTRDQVGGLYRASLLAASDGRLRFEPVGTLGLPVVTDAETSRDGLSVVVRTPREAVVYRSADILRGHYAPFQRVSLYHLGEPQGEAVALEGSTLVVASEGPFWNRGSFVALTCDGLR